MSEVSVSPIRNETDYEAALARVGVLWGSAPDTPEGDELDVLLPLVDAWEEEHHSIETPDPVEAIRFRMEQLGLERSDLNEIIGGRNRVSEVFLKRRRLSLEMIRKLNAQLKIPAEVLIRDYELDR